MCKQFLHFNVNLTRILFNSKRVLNFLSFVSMPLSKIQRIRCKDRLSGLQCEGVGVQRIGPGGVDHLAIAEFERLAVLNLVVRVVFCL